MTDFLDKLKALSNRPIASESETLRSDVQFHPTQPDSMALDPDSQPSVPQAHEGVSPSLHESRSDHSSSTGESAGHSKQVEAAATSSDAKTDAKSIQSSQAHAAGRSHPPATRMKQWISKRWNSDKPYHQRWAVWIMLGLGAIAGGTYFTAQESLKAARRDLPNPDAVFTFVRDGTLTIKAANGTVLQQMGPATRESIAYENIPPQLVEAFIAAEDKNFYAHDGVDYQAVVRAVRANVLARDVVEGGSTITQQLARIVFLDRSPTLERKIREAMLAQKIEQELSKQEILERYLNLVYLGSGAYGVADAAWIYFSKTVDELTTSEMAMIAGLAPAPSVYSPLESPEAARQQRDNTLERMVETEAITEAEKNGLINEPLEITPSLPKNFYSAVPYFTSYIEDQLPNYVSSEQLEQGGLTIETTLNLEWQSLAEETIKQALADYGGGQRFSQAAMVTVDPRTGEIKTMVGGTDFLDSQFNRVTQAQRQPGSTFKTFVYSAAIAAGFSPYKDYVDAKFVVDGYEPKNYGRNYRGNVSMRDALTSSINIVAVKTLIDVGFTPVIDLAHAMGIKSELLPTYSLSLGASEVNLLELTSAYGTLANKGNYVDVHGIVRIRDRYNEVIYEAKPQPQRALDETSAAIMTWMLQGVVRGGTGSRATIDRPVAGKTGTSEERRDLWFVGYIPQLVTGVWLGNDDNQPTWGASSTAAQVWRNFMKDAVNGMPVEEFPALPNLNNRESTIQAQPVKPGRVTAAQSAGSSDTQRSRSSSSSESSATESGASTPRRSGSTSESNSGRAANSGNSSEVSGASSNGSAPTPPAGDSAPSPVVDSPPPAPAPAPAPPPPPPMPAVQPPPPPAPAPAPTPVAPTNSGDASE
ncbi:MAG: PBP1A family penicillin-binding protein [Elainellaceae cyanobacterium]